MCCVYTIMCVVCVYCVSEVCGVYVCGVHVFGGICVVCVCMCVGVGGWSKDPLLIIIQHCP